MSASKCVVSAADYRQHFAPVRERITTEAAVIDACSERLLLIAQRELKTTDQALILYHDAAGLRDRLDAIATMALDQADALAGQPKVLGKITPECPWGIES